MPTSTLPPRTGGDYFMEDPREAERLRAKVEPVPWALSYVRPLLQPGARVLEVGCGPGALAAAVAALPEQPSVVGVDQSSRRLAQQVTPPVGCELRLQVGEATALPLDEGTFDLAYTRFMLQYLPDPGAAIVELHRVVAPGGHVLLQDLDGQLVWHDGLCEELEHGLAKVMAHLGRTGFDPHVGRRLFGLARRAGLADLQVHVQPYHQIFGRASDHELELWELKLDIARPQVREALGHAAGDRLIELFLAHLTAPDTGTYSNVLTVVGRKA